jgi:hypothetical protein
MRISNMQTCFKDKIQPIKVLAKKQSLKSKFCSYLSLGTCNKGKSAHFEISIKLRIPISTYLKKENFGPFLVTFSLFLGPKHSFPHSKA